MAEPEPAIDTDILDRKGRGARILLAIAVSAAFTFVCMNAMIHSGRGPQKDPVGQASVVIVAIAMFLLVAGVVHKIIVRVHEAKKRAQRRP